jgi:molybdopterin-guanine dinucleotide biosynthesis protein A
MNQAPPLFTQPAAVGAAEPRMASRARQGVTGVVLAGGRGSRMGGRDKGLLAYNGRTLVEHQLELLRPQVDTLLISANRNLDCYAVHGVPVIRDSIADFPGPLAGMLAALHVASTPWVVCVACDTLGLPGSLVARLLASATEENRSAAYVADAEGPQYTVCALRTTLADPLEAALRSGRRAVREFLHAQHAACSTLADTRLRNLNTPQPALETVSC